MPGRNELESYLVTMFEKAGSADGLTIHQSKIDSVLEKIAKSENKAPIDPEQHGALLESLAADEGGYVTVKEFMAKIGSTIHEKYFPTWEIAENEFLADAENEAQSKLETTNREEDPLISMHDEIPVTFFPIFTNNGRECGAVTDARKNPKIETFCPGILSQKLPKKIFFFLGSPTNDRPEAIELGVPGERGRSGGHERAQRSAASPAQR